MKEQIDHIERSGLPWRENSNVTECGANAHKVRTITRAEFESRLKEYGQQRTGLFTCMTCMQTARRWPTWEQEPRVALGREVAWECPSYNLWTTAARHDTRGQLLKHELLALEALVTAHPDEFRGLVDKLEGRERWLALKSKKGGE